MKIRSDSGLPLVRKLETPATPPPPEEEKRDLIRGLGSVTVGNVVTDLSMGLAHSFGHNSLIPAMGLGMAALHAARGAAFLWEARGKEGVLLQHRLGTAAGEGLVALGNVLGAAGAGPLCLPLIVSGTALTAASDYRYRKHFQIDAPLQSSLSSTQASAGLVDGTLGACYLIGSNPLGYAAGLAHGVAAAKYYLGHEGDKHSRHSKGFGNAMLAAAHLAGACGAGPWALGPLLGGMLTVQLQDQRDPR